MNYIYELTFYVIVRCKDDVRYMTLTYDECHDYASKEDFDIICKRILELSIEGCVKHYNFLKEECNAHFINKHTYQKLASGNSEYTYKLDYPYEQYS